MGPPYKLRFCVVKRMALFGLREREREKGDTKTFHMVERVGWRRKGMACVLSEKYVKKNKNKTKPFFSAFARD